MNINVRCNANAAFVSLYSIVIVTGDFSAFQNCYSSNNEILRRTVNVSVDC